jgi:NitT/TauT family transport system permease protein
MSVAERTTGLAGEESAERRPLLGRLVSPSLWGPIIVMIVTITAWEAGLFHAIFGFRTFTVPYPSAILAGVDREAPRIIAALGETVPAAFVGYVSGIAVGFSAAAVLILLMPAVANRVVPVLASVNALPIAAVAPLLALWMGAGFWLKVAVVIIMTTPTMLVYTVRGLSSVNSSALELLDSYDASPATVFRVVRVPTAMPFVMTGMKSCVVLALIGTIVTEVVTGFRGLGFVIIESLGAFRTVLGWLALLTISGLGIGWYLLVELLERLVVPWEAAAREGK